MPLECTAARPMTLDRFGITTVSFFAHPGQKIMAFLIALS